MGKYAETNEYYQKGKLIARQYENGFNTIKEIKEYLEKRIKYFKEKGITFYYGDSIMSSQYHYKGEDVIINYNKKERKLNITFKDSTNSIIIKYK